ncbi:MAG: AAS bifunctional protein, partial [Ignavibacteria bacterium RIFCSPLOWO2_12_FULL_56_21]
MLLHRKFIEIAKQYSSKVFINDRMMGRKVSYQRALIGSMIVANKLKRYDEGFIGIMLPTSAGAVLAMLGAMMSGRIPVMINYSTGAAQNCEFAQRRCDFRTIITARALLDKINCPKIPGMVFMEEVMAEVSGFDKIKAAIKSRLSVASLTRQYAGGAKDDTAFVLFTSGSEKDPKAVQLTHRNILSNIRSLEQVYTFTSDDVFLAQLPYFHIFGQTANLWTPIYFGMTIATYANPLDFKTICDIIREEKCSIVVGTPSFFWGYLNKSQRGDFASVRLLLTGADKCPDMLRKGFFEHQDKVLLEAYGATETSPGITVNTPDFNRPGSVGRPLPGVRVRVEHYETGEECPVGEIGKILVQGDNVMKGYFDDF